MNSMLGFLYFVISFSFGSTLQEKFVKNILKDLYIYPSCLRDAGFAIYFIYIIQYGFLFLIFGIPCPLGQHGIITIQTSLENMH